MWSGLRLCLCGISLVVLRLVSSLYVIVGHLYRLWKLFYFFFWVVREILDIDSFLDIFSQSLGCIFFLMIPCWILMKSVLVLCQLDTSRSRQRGRNLNWENTSMRSSCRQACRMFSWLVMNVMDVGGPSPLVPPPSGWYWVACKTSWRSHGEQAAKQCSSASASGPAARFLPSAAALSSLHDGLWALG